MKKLSHLLFLMVFSLTESVAITAAQAADPAFDVINDVDTSFFMTNPKLPWGEDPFLKQPGFAKVKKPDEAFSLGGIVYSKDGQMAIVNGKMVRTGDQVGDRQVSEIGDNYVLLKKGASEVELSLPPLNTDENTNDDDDEEGDE